MSLCLDFGPVRALCDGQGPQGVLPSRAVPSVSLAEDRDAVLQKPGLRFWSPSVSGTQDS